MAYTSMANSEMLVKLTTDNSGRWTIVPVANGNIYQSLHYNSSMTSWTWRADDGGYAAASTWTIENVPDMMVPEVVSQDYERYMKRLNGFDGTPMQGKLGQARSSELLQAAKDSIALWNSNIAHESYDRFLAKWAKLAQKTIVYSTNADVNKLIDLLISARAEKLRYAYSDTGVGFYPATSTKALDDVIEVVAQSLAAGSISAEDVRRNTEKLNNALLQFHAAMSGGSFNQPKASNDKVQYGYRMYTPNRDNRYVTSNGIGQALIGTTNPINDNTIWDFYRRSDGSYDIRNRADGSYISPASANDQALRTTTQQPRAGWKLQKSNADMLFLITSANNVMFNQTQSGLGWKVYNWGGFAGQNGASDAGCQYKFVFVGEHKLPTALANALELDATVAKVYDLSGRRVSEAAAHGIYIVNQKKVGL